MPNRRGPRFIADERGSTLLELLISHTIFALLLPVLAAGLLFVTHAWKDGTSRLEARETALALLHRIEADARTAQAAELLPSGVVFTNPAGRIVRYQHYAKTRLVLRDEQDTLGTVAGSHVTRLQLVFDPSTRLLRLHLTIQVRSSRFTIEGLWHIQGKE